MSETMKIWIVQAMVLWHCMEVKGEHWRNRLRRVSALLNFDDVEHSWEYHEWPRKQMNGSSNKSTQDSNSSHKCPG